LAIDLRLLPATVDGVAPNDGCIVPKSAYVTDVAVFKGVVDGGDVVLSEDSDAVSAGSTSIKDNFQASNISINTPR